MQVGLMIIIFGVMAAGWTGIEGLWLLPLIIGVVVMYDEYRRS